MTRQGSPAKPQDLEKVGAGRAGLCVWMAPDRQQDTKHSQKVSCFLEARLCEVSRHYIHTRTHSYASHSRALTFSLGSSEVAGVK